MYQSVRATLFAYVSFGVPIRLDVLVVEMHGAQLYSRSKKYLPSYVKNIIRNQV
jgi:hypothetical protein